MNPESFQAKLAPVPTQNTENTKTDTETCFQEPNKARELSELFGRLWEAADELRANSKLRSTQYSTPVLGILFLRYAYYKFEEATKELEKKYAGRDRPIRKLDYQAEGAIYLTEKARYKYLLELPEGASIGKAIDDAMRSIEDENEELRDVLPKVYTNMEDSVLINLLKIFHKIPTKLDRDIFGKIYEYFLGKFAMSEGQRGGEFYTPTSIVRLIVEVIEPYHGRILDPACGSGGMFVQSAEFVKAHLKNPYKEISIYGQEKADDTVRLCKMNLAIHGLSGDIKQGNTYYEDVFNKLGQFDFVIANPPFNVNNVDKDAIKDDPRYPFGLPTVDNANYLWIQVFYSMQNGTGRAGFVMANSATDAGYSELDIRKKIIEKGLVDVVISVASNFFYTVTLPVTLWFLNKGKKNTAEKDKVLFIDARKIFRQIDRAHREFTPQQIEFISNIVRLYRGKEIETAKCSSKIMEMHFPNSEYQDIAGLCKVASINKIKNQGWSLNPGRYVGIEKRETLYDDFHERLTLLKKELENLNEESRMLESQISDNMNKILTKNNASTNKKKFRKVKLNEVLTKIIGGGTPSKKEIDYWNGDIPWATVKDMPEDNYYLYDTEDHIAEKGVENSATHIIPKGTLIISTRMGLGRFFINKVDMAINQDLKALFPNNKIITPYLLLAYSDKSEYVKSIGTGTTVKGIRLEDLKEIGIELPHIEIQKKIASIIFSYENLIWNNKTRIKTLERITQSLYNEWFVNLRFPGHENTEINQTPNGPTPKGWKWYNLFDIADVTFGKALKSEYFNEESKGFPIVRIRDIPKNCTNTYTPESAERKYVVKNGDILVGMDGDFHMCRWAGGDAYLVQRVARFRSKGSISPYFLFWALKKHIEYFNATIIGTTVAHLGKKHLETVNILVPREEITEKANQIFNPYYQQEINLRIKNAILKDMRDSLLPKLISGEIDVSMLDISISGD